MKRVLLPVLLMAASATAWAQSSLPPHLQGRSQEQDPAPHQTPPGPVTPQQPPSAQFDFDFTAERPTNTIAPYNVAGGVLQLETGMYFLKNSDTNFDAKQWTTRVDVRYGFTPSWELVGELELLKDSDLVQSGDTHAGFGLGDFRAGAKWSLLQQNGTIPSAGAIIVWKIPTGNEGKGLGSGSGDLEVRGLWGYEIENIRINFNNGFAFISDPTETRTFRLQYINMLEIQVKLDDLIVFGEVNYLTSAQDRRGTQTSMMGGVAYYLNKDVRLDAALRFGLSTGADDIVFTIGISFIGAKV